MCYRFKKWQHGNWTYMITRLRKKKIKWELYPVIRLMEISDVHISKDCKFGHENAMQASIVASTSLQSPNTRWKEQINTKLSKLKNYFLNWPISFNSLKHHCIKIQSIRFCIKLKIRPKIINWVSVISPCIQLISWYSLFYQCNLWSISITHLIIFV